MNPKHFKTLVILVLIIILYKAFKFYTFPERPTIDKIIVRDKSGKETEKVKVSVYYEALCPDSKFFITYQLVPVFEKLKNYLIVDLVPYGKAETIIDDSGNIDFRCQHDQVQLKYIACMITDNAIPEDAAERCGHEPNIDFLPIKKCATEKLGSLLLKKYGEKTHALKPKVRFIPTVELNDSQVFETQAIILKDLLKAVCKVFRDKPPGCANV